MKICFPPVVRRSILLFPAFLGLLAAPFPANAATYSWNVPNANNKSWNDAANWLPSTGYPNAVDAVADFYLDFAPPAQVNFNGSPVIGTLIVGDSAGTQYVRFNGGGTSTGLKMQVSAGSAAITKESGNLVEFLRPVAFASSAVITANGGEIRWSAGSGNYGSISGSGNLSFEGAGGVSTLNNEAGTFSTAFSGNITVQNNGTLLIGGTFQASSAVPGASVTVAGTGTLGGSGTVERATSIQSGGTLFVGGSISSGSSFSTQSGSGLMTYAAGLEFKSGSRFNFELFSNATAGRGLAGGFDAVNVTGGLLSIEDGAVFNLVLNSVGSTVDFADSFWRSGQQWLVFGNSMAPSVTPGIFTLGTVSADKNGLGFSATGGTFSFLQNGNDVYLNYSPVPEPSTWALFIGLGIGGMAFRRRIPRTA